MEPYDLSKDVGEMNDLASESPELVEKLAWVMGKQLRGVDAGMSIESATGKTVEWPDEVVVSSDVRN